MDGPVRCVRRVSGSPAELRERLERARVHFKSDDEEIKELERRLRLIGRSLPQQGLDDTLPFFFHPKSEAL